LKEKEEGKVIIDTEIYLQYSTLKAYYRELWEQHKKVVLENEKLREEIIRMKRGDNLARLPRFEV
jgi:hypothetical protein